MTRNLPRSLILPILAVLPFAATAACKHSSSGGSGGGSGGTQPTATSTSSPSSTGTSDQPSANNDDNNNDNNSDGGGGGGGGHKRAKRHKGGPGEGDGGDFSGKIAINKPTPEPIAAPALKHAPKEPTLPNLPERSKYPKPSEIPKSNDTEHCGSVWTGHDYMPVDCIDPSVHAKQAKAAKVVVPYEKMKQPPEKMPKIVDHRFDGTEGPVRTQGGPQCTAFAFTAGLDHAFARWAGEPAEFSVMQIWARYHKLEEKAATDSNVGDYVAEEADWPYDAKLANSWDSCKKKGKGDCGKPMDESKLKELDKKKIAEITQVEVVPITQFDVLKEKIAGGADVTVGLKLPSFETAGEAGAKYIVGAQKGTAKEGHEVLLSGYAVTPHGTYFLVHNSWGERWGDKGYAWLHEELLKTYWLDNRAVIADVQPVEVAEARAHAHGGLTAKCEKGKVPDSISGECAGKCPDGGPRHNNACADEKKKECPEGAINLAGECSMAAPKGSGSEGKVKWECAPSGCTYEVPKGEFDCKEKECQVSCPAPEFRLATSKKGLVCVE